MSKIFYIKIQNLTEDVFSLYQNQNFCASWNSPSSINPGETTETQLEFLEAPEGENNYAKLRFSAPAYKCFEIQAYSEGGDHLEIFVSESLTAHPSSDIPIVNEETLTVSFEEAEKNK